jgi:hypothetical protein
MKRKLCRHVPHGAVANRDDSPCVCAMPKIQMHAGSTIRINQHVLGLDVRVDDALGVQIVDVVNHVREHTAHIRLCHPGVQPLIQVSVSGIDVYEHETGKDLAHSCVVLIRGNFRRGARRGCSHPRVCELWLLREHIDRNRLSARISKRARGRKTASHSLCSSASKRLKFRNARGSACFELHFPELK